MKRTPDTFIADPGSPAFLAALCPGDVLLFNRKSIYNWVINVKTWSRISHVEVVETANHGHVTIAASRNGKGVKRFEPDWRGLALVLRPVPTLLGLDVARAWFETVRGQKYDWLGLLNFAYARAVGKDNGKMFCSEFATRFMRRAGLPLFPEQDADTIAPRDFLLTSQLYPVWRSTDEWQRFWQFRRDWNNEGS